MQLRDEPRHASAMRQVSMQADTDVGLLDVLGAGDEVASSVVAAACTVNLCACCLAG